MGNIAGIDLAEGWNFETVFNRPAGNAGYKTFPACIEREDVGKEDSAGRKNGRGVLRSSFSLLLGHFTTLRTHFSVLLGRFSPLWNNFSSLLHEFAALLFGFSLGRNEFSKLIRQVDRLYYLISYQNNEVTGSCLVFSC